MGEFAAVMEAAESAQQAEPVAAETPETSSVTAEETTPESSETPPVADPERPPTTAQAPPIIQPSAKTTPAQAQASKVVPLQALQEARAQTKALRESYSWLPSDRAPAFRAFYDAYARDPVDAIVGELQDLLQHPEYGQRLKAMIQGGGGQGAAPSQETPEPQPDLQTADGTLVYSAPQLAKWHQWRGAQDEQRFEARLQPLQAFVKTQQQQQAMGQAKERAGNLAKSLFQEMQAYPHFATHKPQIREKFAQYSQSMDGRSALQKAYLDVLHETILPSLSQTERTKVVSALNQKPGASSPNPARPGSPAGTRTPLDFREAAERLLR